MRISMKGGDLMKKTWPVVSGVLAVLIIGGMALAQMSGSGTDTDAMGGKHMGCGRGKMGADSKSTMSDKMASGKMPCGMANRSVLHSYVCCPMMTTHSSVDYFLSHSENIELSSDQVESLKVIRDSRQEERVQQAAELETAMLELDNLLSEDEIDLDVASELNQRIEAIRTRARFREIEAFAEAKRVLNTEQHERLRSFDTGSLRHESHHEMMHR
jgi:hypothetical protein